MDEAYLATLCPAILTYCAICFPIFFALPRFKAWLRAQLDSRIADGHMPLMDYFIFEFYISISRRLDIIAGIFLVGALVVLFSPLGIGVQFASLAIALLGTTLLVAMVIVDAIREFRKAVAAAEVIF